ncbi:MAG: hypothetical protein ACXU8N_18315 [Telluria sp.]
MTLDLALAMLKVSEALREKLVDEKAALLALPSPIFTPRSDKPEGRVLERQAFAKGLHYAAAPRGPRA